MQPYRRGVAESNRSYETVLTSASVCGSEWRRIRWSTSHGRRVTSGGVDRLDRLLWRCESDGRTIVFMVDELGEGGRSGPGSRDQLSSPSSCNRL